MVLIHCFSVDANDIKRISSTLNVLATEKTKVTKVIFEMLTGELKKERSAFERLLLPEYISNDILQYLIE